MITPKVLKTEQEYEKALARIEEIMDAEPGTPQMDELELFTLLVETYENERYPMDLPDPIEAIKFRMEQQGLTRKDMRAYLGSQARVSEVLSGKRQLSKEMMRKLHAGLGIPAGVLLQEPGTVEVEPCQYDPTLYPLKEMLKRGYLAFDGDLRQAKTVGEQLLESFFAVFEGQRRQPVYCRGTHGELDTLALEAWQAQVLHLAQRMELPDYVVGSVTETWTRNLVRLSYIDSGPTLVQEYLAKKGIHFVVLAHLPKTRIDGACFLAPDGNPVIAVTLRYDRVDSFWFTLAHELGHLVLHMEPQSVTGRVFFDELEDGGSGERTAEELEADTYAADALVPRDAWLQHRETLVDSTTAVLEFAEQLGVSPAIVAGRARWESGDYAKLNHLLGRGKMAALFSNSIATGVA